MKETWLLTCSFRNKEKTTLNPGLPSYQEGFQHNKTWPCMTTNPPKLLLPRNIVHQILVRFSPPFFNLNDHVVQSFGFNTSAMLLLSGSCKNCQSSSSSMPVKQRSTVSLLTSSNLEDSHWKKKGKNENESIQTTSLYLKCIVTNSCSNEVAADSVLSNETLLQILRSSFSYLSRLSETCPCH